jgi:acetyl-CoA carboxylase carboxyltransferase component
MTSDGRADASSAGKRASDWGPEVEEIARRRELAERMGGPEKVARQHAAGRLTVRERIAALVDPGSGLLTTHDQLYPLTGA